MARAMHGLAAAQPDLTPTPVDPMPVAKWYAFSFDSRRLLADESFSVCRTFGAPRCNFLNSAKLQRIAAAQDEKAPHGAGASSMERKAHAN
jgi:hypothetical protein